MQPLNRTKAIEAGIRKPRRDQMSNAMTRSGRCECPQLNEIQRWNRYRSDGPRLSRKRFLWLIVFMIIGTACLTRISTAQAITADIVGTVTDAGGAIVPGARVTILNAETQLQRSMAATSTGDYVFTLLPPGTYTIRVEQSGFKTFAAKGVKVTAGDR